MNNLPLEIERLQLIWVLCRRAVRVHLRESLRETHKDPFVPRALWDAAARAYVLMFPEPDETDRHP